MFLNTARVLNEAMQLALKGSKVFVLCTHPNHGQGLAENLIEATASIYLLYDEPKECTHGSIGGWAVRYRNNGEVFFSFWDPIGNDYFDHFFVFAPSEEIRAELVAKGDCPQVLPLFWTNDSSLVRQPVYVPNRYERVMANLQDSTWATSR